MNCWSAIPPIGNIEAYISAIAKFPMLTLEEEIECGNKMDDESVAKLVLSHLRLAASIARKFNAGNRNLADLIQEANLGLLLAARRFKPELGRFATFAMTYIKSPLYEFALKNARSLSIATTKAHRKLYFNLVPMKRAILGDNERRTLSMAQMQEIADKLNATSKGELVSARDVMEMDMRMSTSEFSINVSSDDDMNSLVNNIPADEAFEPSNILIESQRNYVLEYGLDEALECLTERERFIIQNRRLISDSESGAMTLHELSAMYGVSAERIRQIEVAAMKKMKKFMTKHVEFA